MRARGMSEALERALRILDDGLAACPADDEGYAPPGSEDLDLCWRCIRAAPDPEGSSGLCADCRTVLADEDYVADEPCDPWGPSRVMWWEPSSIRFVGPRVDWPAIITRFENLRVRIDGATRYFDYDEALRCYPPPLRRLGARRLRPVPAKAAHRRRYSRG